MNIRGIVALKLGSRIFLRPSECSCDQCPRIDLTQARLLTDIDAISVGDKMESYTGSQWYRVDQFTANPSYDGFDDALSDLFGGNMPTLSDTLDEQLKAQLKAFTIN